jgi:hypothetical protein
MVAVTSDATKTPCYRARARNGRWSAPVNENITTISLHPMVILFTQHGQRGHASMVIARFYSLLRMQPAYRNERTKIDDMWVASILYVDSRFDLARHLKIGVAHLAPC